MSPLVMPDRLSSIGLSRYPLHLCAYKFLRAVEKLAHVTRCFCLHSSGSSASLCAAWSLVSLGWANSTSSGIWISPSPKWTKAYSAPHRTVDYAQQNFSWLEPWCRRIAGAGARSCFHRTTPIRVAGKVRLPACASHFPRV